MRWWPWRRRRCAMRRDERVPDGNGHAATAARQVQERKLRDAWRLWPDVRAARDELAWLAEQAMRRQR